MKLDFRNTRTAFSSKSKSELRNAYILFTTIKHSSLVGLAKWATNIALKLRLPLAWAVKPTLYKQFVGGETLNDCKKVLSHLDKYNIKATFDYSAEGDESERSIKLTFEETLRSIAFAKGKKNVAFAVFKPSTIVADEVLAKASEQREKLTIEEVVKLREFKERFMALCQKAYDNDVKIIVDAEDYCYQRLLDELTDDAMRQFNGQKAIVFATLQMYRHDRMPYLRQIVSDAREHKFVAGVKFVRGAYMEAERKRAVQMGYQDPICATKSDTDDNFDKGVEYAIDNIDTLEIFAGTHNEESNYKLAKLMEERKIERNDSRIYFAQLLGMSDNISYNLSAAGYNVTKYVPYARVKDVLPYLIRRAEENTSVAGQTNRELEMLRKEMRRRKK